MRRVLLWSVSALLSLGVLLTLMLVLNVEEVPLPAPDAQQPIELPDGSIVSLGSWLERALTPSRAPVEPLLANVAAATDVDALYPGMPWGPVFRLGEYQRQAGRLDQALALFQSIPRDDPDYSIARRRIALELADRGEVITAVGVVKQGLAAEPFSVNAWQDLVRVYGRRVGFGFD